MTQVPHDPSWKKGENLSYDKAHNTNRDGAGHDISYCQQFNISSQKVEGGLADTQSGPLVEEVSFHEGSKEIAERVIFTHSQSNAIQPSHACDKRKLPIDRNKHEACINDYTSESNLVIEADLSSAFSEPCDSEVAVCAGERFCTLSEIPLHYGPDFPNIFESILPCIVQGEHPSDHCHDINCGAYAEDYDAFQDDVLWKEIALQDFYIPWMKEGRLTPAEVPEVAYRYDWVKVSHICGREKDKDGRKSIVAPPPTLVSPMSHISNPNAGRPVNIAVVSFPTGSWRLARISECLAVLDSLSDGNQTPVISPITNVTATKWLHLPLTERRKPFARLAPPQAVQQRSVIEGLGAKTVIRVCFRVGEAVRLANTARRISCGGRTDIIIELFGLHDQHPCHHIWLTNFIARVTFAERIGPKQNVQFGTVIPFAYILFVHHTKILTSLLCVKETSTTFTPPTCPALIIFSVHAPSGIKMRQICWVEKVKGRWCGLLGK